ncbi:MAG: malQ: 4-alpha-glucanotransferase [Firmicutes bacterium]|nr:malQ: 4-alpha-glucanotransferase [Bacillota bacterium]
MEQEWLIHDSHSLECRRPFGPIVCDSRLFLCIKVRAFRKVDSVVLRLWQEGSGEELIPMQAADVLSDDAWVQYQAEIIGRSTPGLMWYCFILHDGEKTWYYGTHEDGLGGLGRCGNNMPSAYQVTVHPADLRTPAWFKQAVVYQIFVDRFANGREEGSVLNPKPGILVHPHWEDTPVYAKDPATGQVLAYDFFGGNLAGVIKKLPYLAELGVTAIYFNPIFEASSNHKYDTADYKMVDSMFGDNDLFQELCHQAAEQGIAIILDGVFSHTGSDSIYFNKYNRYPELGAYQSKQSLYYNWYLFINYPNEYESWWGVDTLPNVNELDPGYLQYMIEGPDSVLQYWGKIGIRGWRLDVADELPEDFIRILRRRLKSGDAENVLIGEVWEDASRKLSYGKMRGYFHGDELDSVMNYPWRKILLDFILHVSNAEQAARALLSQYENYPAAHFFSNLNVLGTHDVPRILTLLGEAPPEHTLSLAERARFRLNTGKLQLALSRLKLLALWQMTFPGAPCIYYGDEAGLEGYSDPLNRRTYPWGTEKKELRSWYEKLIALRNNYPMLCTGNWEIIWAEGDVIVYRRWIYAGRDAIGQARPDNMAIILLNRGGKTVKADLAAKNWPYIHFVDVLEAGPTVQVHGGRCKIEIPPLSGKLYVAEPQKTIRERQAGILLHLTSLPGPHGGGDLGACAYRFIDFLVLAKQRYWQILPFNPRGEGDSPYQSCSAFAGDPLLIALNPLVEEGLLTGQEVSEAVHKVGPFSAERVATLNVQQLKEPLFQLAFKRFLTNGDAAGFQAFQAEQQSWLKDYALFMALAQKFGTFDWTAWEPRAVQREPVFMDSFRERYREEIEYQTFLQYLFDRQWSALKQYAAASGIQIIGDLPIFVSQNSCDVWANQLLFKLDQTGRPAVVAGVPPDYFSPTGQRWGNPLYDWTAMGADNYRWWKERFQRLLKQVDFIRLDHFRGFASFWEIPSTEETAVHGEWVEGPGQDFFLAMQAACGPLRMIAEDLGHITPDVHALKDRFGFPGMQVLHFAFTPDGGGNCHPIRLDENCVVYTGTHDNDTTVGWYKKLGETDPEHQRCIQRYLGVGEESSPQTVCKVLIQRAYQSRAMLAIIPLQDILGLDSAARMNIPGTATGNWQWRCKPSDLTSMVALELAPLVAASRR